MGDMFRDLAAPFEIGDVQWRVGSTNKEKTKGMALAYVDARAVMDRLDDVCGPTGWQCRYSHVGAVTVCEIGVRFMSGDLSASGDWLWKADGAGQSDIEAEKGALSDAFKRAAVRWGIGRYLYSLPSPWVELENGRYIAKHEHPKLDRLLLQASTTVIGNIDDSTRREAAAISHAQGHTPEKAATDARMKRIADAKAKAAVFIDEAIALIKDQDAAFYADWIGQADIADKLDFVRLECPAEYARFDKGTKDARERKHQ